MGKICYAKGHVIHFWSLSHQTIIRSFVQVLGSVKRL